MKSFLLMNALLATTFTGYAADYSNIRCYEEVAIRDCEDKAIKQDQKMKGVCKAEVTLREYDGTKKTSILTGDAKHRYKDGLTNFGLFTLTLYDKGREKIAKYQVNSDAQENLERELKRLKKTLGKCQ